MLTTIGNFISSVEGFFSGLGDFVGALNQRATWLRVVLVILGTGLMIGALWETVNA